MKNAIIIVLLILSFRGFAQVKIGPTVGAQLTNVKGSSYNTDSRFAFNFGAVALVPVTHDVDIHFQVLASSKGYSFKDIYGYKYTMKPVYLELPVVGRFKFETSEQSKVIVGLGGYYAFGIAGKYYYYESGYKESKKIDFGNSSSDNLKSSDFGIVFQVGADFRENFEGLFFVDWGLSNIIPTATTNTYNRVFGINLAWYFNLNKKQS
ncbi:MAG: porin family protein [Bacteroidia bacterium]